MYAIFERAAADRPRRHRGGAAGQLDDRRPDPRAIPRRNRRHSRCRPIRGSGAAKRCRGSRSRRADVVAAMMWGQVRRVVVDSAGVVINMGRRRRLFTGNARQAILLQSSRCVVAGCATPIRRCQADHMHRMVPSRTHRRRQRGTGVRTTQPAEEHRLPSPPRRPRLLAHLPTRRHRNLTDHGSADDRDTPSSGSGV